ncbi:hypothetical protein Esi_0256_0006 [Ectocarpus siliculosus]|uniref:Uncharacterized protein n=1 Tax=Ectocarpus siliculosus TaxID=2880 RepID=D7FTR0_ECTSI|nr:hypothetical protein Esi_0256_0006 [Ectocarpus siliculosus]|eukprot:CBJ31437.1 hypothetical protein Esi_0256_0006 [Ectocarpus siliculosus]
MIRRDASASRGGEGREEDDTADDFQVDEWSPMLRCSTAPSLATTTTPKSPWYDGETTANDVRASTAGPGMRRAAASHGVTMSILGRDALLDTTNAGAASPQRSRSLRGSALRPRSSATAAWDEGGGRGSMGGRTSPAVVHVRTTKRMDQEMGFLRVGTYFTASKDPLRHGLTAALSGKLVRQTDHDGLKWDLLKQVLKVITGSQHGLPLQAVKEVAATFGTAVGTSKLATKAQFVDNITGKHEGFPESELNTLFGFFRRPMAPGPATATTFSEENRDKFPQSQQRGGVGTNNSRPRTSPGNFGRAGKSGSRGGKEKDGAQGADWTMAVACLRLLAKPKEPVKAAVLGVFDVFARARGDRMRHRHRLEQERLEKERQAQLEEERERWKRRRKREQERGIAPSMQQGLAGPESHSAFALSSADGIGGGGGGDGGDDGRGNSSLERNRVCFAETARMFTLVCSNDQERHAVTTTYRHRFYLELRAVMQEGRNPLRFRNNQNNSGDGGYNSPNMVESDRCLSPPHRPRNRSSKDGKASSLQLDAYSSTETPHVLPTGGRPTTAEPAKERPGARLQKGDGHGRGGASGMGSPGPEENGVTAEEFSEALARCPEMLQAFGSQLDARLRHRHRPIWMAPFMRKGG